MKKNILFILVLFLALFITIQSASSMSWVQYSPSPTTSDLVKVVNFANGKAFAFDTNMDRCFLYNSTDGWSEIYCADDKLNLSYLHYYGTTHNNNFAAKVGNKAIFMFHNSSAVNVSMIEYDSDTGVYSTIFNDTNGPSSTTVDIACFDTQECFYQRANASIYLFYPLSSTDEIRWALGALLFGGNRRIMVTASVPSRILEWSGFGASFNLRWSNSMGGSVNWPFSHLYISSSERVLSLYGTGTGFIPRIYFFNSSSAQFDSSYFVNLTPCYASGDYMHYIDGQIMFVNNVNSSRINALSYGEMDNCPYYAMPTAVSSIDYDSNNLIGWAVGLGGYIYGYNNPSSSANVTISSLSINKRNVCVGETVFGNINAVSGNGSLLLTYDYSCNGSLSSYFGKPYNDFACYYNTAGNRTIYGYAWNDLTYNNPVYTTTEINVSNCTANLSINAVVYDTDTGYAVNGVSAVLSDGQSTTSDSNGNIFFNVGQNDTDYSINLTKSEYYPSVCYAVAHGTIGCYIQKISSPVTPAGQRAILTVNTLDSAKRPISNSLVSVTNGLTGQSQSGLTDGYGRITWIDSITGNNLAISASNVAKGYALTGVYSSLQLGQSSIINITLLLPNQTSGIYSVTDRNCKDAISGVLLCGYLNTAGTGNTCHNDGECIGGRCSKIDKTTLNGECSAFNYTRCDAGSGTPQAGMGRGNWCFFASVVGGGLSDITELMLSFFIFVIVIIIILALIVFMRRKK